MPNPTTPLALSAALALLIGQPALASEKTAATAPQPIASQPRPSVRKAPVKLVDINSASRAELKTLPGIGDAEADRIIAARPYLSKASLLSSKVLSDSAYFALKGRIVAVQPDPAKVKAKAKPAG